ncbi:ICMT-domain-containing protein [Pilatotrama ljubarskyi]|nr:ICMT-domain-containing protein [Pilatotrama ljubarskyi]
MISTAMLKIAALVVATFAEWVAYTPPNARLKAEDTSAYNGGDTLSHVAIVLTRGIKVCCWAGYACEIAALLAKDAHTPTASTIIILLFKDPSAAQRLTFSLPFLLGLLALLSGAALRKWCYRTLGRHFTFQLSVLREHKLVTSGPYGFVRHPSYTGVIAAMGGMLATQFAPGGWLRESGWLKTAWGKSAAAVWVAVMACVSVGFVRGARKEDEVLRKEFGTQWDEWAWRVPYALIPCVY